MAMRFIFDLNANEMGEMAAFVAGLIKNGVVFRVERKQTFFVVELTGGF